jgi:Domain of unknown function (DUF6471)
MQETEAAIVSKLSRGTFAVAFFLATLAVLEIKEVLLDEL